MQSLNKTIIGITVWHEIYLGSNYREFFIDPRKLNPVKTNSLQKKIPQKFTLFIYIAEFQ